MNIAYCTDDQYNGFEAKLLSMELLRYGLPLLEQFYLGVERRYPQVSSQIEVQRDYSRRSLNLLVTDLMENSLAQRSMCMPLEE